MKYLQKYFLTLTMIILIATGCKNGKTDEETQMIKQKISQFAETELKYDESLLDDNQKMVVKKLYEAAKIIDDLFMEQVYSQNDKIKNRLKNSTSQKDKLLLDYFNIMFGPFDRLDHNKPFIGHEEKPLGANFYPEDITKKEFQNYVKNNPDEEKNLTSEFTVIRRKGDKLIALPYSEFYNDKLTKISTLVKEASNYADNPSLKKYLLTVSKSFLTNDYYDSDMAWMDLKDHSIEVIIGPYEVYEDELFNYKASFECFLTLVDPAESQKLQKFGSYLKEIEKNLPIPDKYKNFERGSDSPIVVVQEIFGAGDNKAGVQTLAFNLPNDERVRKAKGSKKVMIKNMHQAKFDKLLMPIAKRVLDPDQLKYVTFDGFFNHTLMHEMSHGVGPGFITVNGRKTEVKKELQETYSTMEEMKADILGMYNNIFMIDKGVFPKTFSNETWVTFLAGTFRSIRFGINEAHGGGNAIIYNFLMENSGYEFDEKTGKVRVNFDKIYDALKKLANKVLVIQATGDYEGAKMMIEQYRVITPRMKKLLDKLSDLPVDIKPVYQIEK